MADKHKPWIPQPPEDFTFLNARIVDPAAGTVSPPSSVSISHGKVSAISDQYTSNAHPAGSRSIDLAGKFLCPGLIDCHVHITATPGSASVRDIWDAHPDTLAFRTAWTAKQMLLRGFTTARDTGGANSALRAAIAEHLIPGPRLFICGKALSQTGGHGDLRLPHHDDVLKCCSGHGPSLARLCDGVPACLAAARDELRRGADFLKIMVGGGVVSPVDPLDMLQFTPAEIQAITASARNLGKSVTAHAYTNEAIRLAVENGVSGIEHGNFVDGDTARMCAERGVVVTPTLVTYRELISEAYADFLPESGREKGRRVLKSGVESLKIWRDAGVMLCFGTDLLAGMHVSQNDEFQIRKQALSNVEVLQSATTNAAKLLGMEGLIGTIERGAWADFLVLDANPLDDVGVLAEMDRCCFAIVKEGRVVMTRLEADGLRVDEVYR